MMRALIPGELIAVYGLGNVWRAAGNQRHDIARARCLAHVTPGVGEDIGVLTFFLRSACCPALPHIYGRMRRPPVDVRGLQ